MTSFGWDVSTVSSTSTYDADGTNARVTADNLLLIRVSMGETMTGGMVVSVVRVKAILLPAAFKVRKLCLPWHGDGKHPKTTRKRAPSWPASHLPLLQPARAQERRACRFWDTNSRYFPAWGILPKLIGAILFCASTHRRPNAHNRRSRVKEERMRRHEQRRPLADRHRLRSPLLATCSCLPPIEF